MTSHAPCTIATAQPTYGFAPLKHDGLYLLLLVDTRHPGSRPLYTMVCETSAQWDVAAKWLMEHKDKWQHWGALGRISHDRLTTHIEALLEIEPMDPAVEACLFTESRDGRTLTLSELLRTRGRHQSSRMVWQRTFASKAKCRRAKAWILRHHPKLDTLAALACEEGGDAVDALLNRGLGSAV